MQLDVIEPGGLQSHKAGSGRTHPQMTQIKNFLKDKSISVIPKTVLTVRHFRGLILVAQFFPIPLPSALIGVICG